jgi:hypothetical protein
MKKIILEKNSGNLTKNNNNIILTPAFNGKIKQQLFFRSITTIMNFFPLFLKKKKMITL